MSLDHPASLEKLFEDLTHPNPNIQRDAYWQMADHYPDQAIPRLLLLIHDEDPGKCRTAGKALGADGERSFDPLIKLFYQSENGTVRACCVKALVQIAVNFPEIEFPNNAIKVLSNALNDSSPVVAQSALMTLGFVAKATKGGERAIPILVNACQSENIAHVQAAVMALAEVDSPIAHKCLCDLAETKSIDPLIKEVVHASLERIKTLKANKL